MSSQTVEIESAHAQEYGRGQDGANALPASSFSIFSRYALMALAWVVLPLASSLPSMDETILHDARRAPMTFLYATERRLRSSIESSELSDAMDFICETICRGGREDASTSVHVQQFQYARLRARPSPLCQAGSITGAGERSDWGRGLTSS